LAAGEQKRRAAFRLQSKDFFLRLLVSYFLIPLIPPALLLLRTPGVSRMAFGDWLGIVLIYAAFGLAVMLVLGTPLLFCYSRLGWTGFLPFMAGGGVCAGITSYAVLRGGRNTGLIGFFAVAGILSGLFFRLILFGLRHRNLRS